MEKKQGEEFIHGGTPLLVGESHIVRNKERRHQGQTTLHTHDKVLDYRALKFNSITPYMLYRHLHILATSEATSLRVGDFLNSLNTLSKALLFLIASKDSGIQS